MNLRKMIEKALALIEELNPDSEMLTDDPELDGYPELKAAVEKMYARSGNILN